MLSHIKQNHQSFAAGLATQRIHHRQHQNACHTMWTKQTDVGCGINASTHKVMAASPNRMDRGLPILCHMSRNMGLSRLASSLTICAAIAPASTLLILSPFHHVKTLCAAFLLRLYTLGKRIATTGTSSRRRIPTFTTLGGGFAGRAAESEQKLSVPPKNDFSIEDAQRQGDMFQESAA